jgi:hypothetical protein
MGYTKELELKIVRSKHKITFNDRTDIQTFINELSQVPKDATVDECYEKDGEYILIFHHEGEITKQ